MGDDPSAGIGMGGLCVLRAAYADVGQSTWAPCTCMLKTQVHY